MLRKYTIYFHSILSRGVAVTFLVVTSIPWTVSSFLPFRVTILARGVAVNPGHEKEFFLPMHPSVFLTCTICFTAYGSHVTCFCLRTSYTLSSHVLTRGVALNFTWKHILLHTSGIVLAHTFNICISFGLSSSVSPVTLKIPIFPGGSNFVLRAGYTS